jgi:hypothetical protein
VGFAKKTSFFLCLCFRDFEGREYQFNFKSIDRSIKSINQSTNSI